MKSTFFGIALVILLSLTAIPFPLSGDESVILQNTTEASLVNLSAEHVDDVPYVWQEINGFCLWAALSMVFQHAGAPLDLANLFAVSGVGFSSVYVRDTGVAYYRPGVWFRQVPPVGYVSEQYGLNCTFFIDPNSGLGTGTVLYLDAIGANYTPITGESEAFALLQNAIDEGHPLALWTDPYYLPAVDYDIVRELNITADVSLSGHAIVAVGYNDTAGTAQIMDPGVGAFGDELYGYPTDGRWYYSINYTDLNDAWSALGYGSFLIKPGSEPVEDFEDQLANMVC
ncbi:MAG: C39 family peptidase, partial [Candidatus Odinarchaeota archaeon]